jgi:hypothetical protein
MSMLSFLAPGLWYWGLGLATIPILIHLLNRRRFRRIDWAPMKYLKLSIRRNRRRIQIEQWILLAMRVLAILLLFAAVARPVLDSTGIGKYLGARSRTSQILLIDDSLSMGLRDADGSALERAKKFASAMIESIGPQDRLTIALASRPKQPLRRNVQLADPEELAKTVADVQAIEPTAAHLAWPAALDAMTEIVETATYPTRQIAIFTDMRKAGWEGATSEAKTRFAGDRTSVRIVDVGGGEAPNLAILAFDPVDRVALAGSVAHFTATIANSGAQGVEGKEATLTVDGKPSPLALPKIAGGSAARIPVELTFQEAGPHRISLELPDDALPGDNKRFITVDVRESLDLLIVDGEPSASPFQGETDFLSLVLTVGGAGAWRIESMTDSTWDPNPQSGMQYDAVVLANVAQPTQKQAEWLEKFVAKGGGLAVFHGDQVQSEAYNRLLYRDGKGPLPAQLDGIADSDAGGLALEDVSPSPLEILGRARNSATYLQQIKPKKIGLVKPPDAAAGAKVLARWNDPQGSPAAIERVYGEGKSLLWTVTADREWSDWPAQDLTYFPAIRESILSVARSGAAGRTMTAGSPLRWSVPDTAGDPTIEAPGVKDPARGGIDGEGKAGAKAFTWDDTYRAGFYRLSYADIGRKQADFAVNPDRRESELARAEPADVKSAFGAADVEIVSAGTPGAKLLGDEIWRGLAIGLLTLLVLEAAFATWVGRQR